MSREDNKDMEIAALQALNEELEEANERLRAENAVLRDKLEEKGIDPDPPKKMKFKVKPRFGDHSDVYDEYLRGLAWMGDAERRAENQRMMYDAEQMQYRYVPDDNEYEINITVDRFGDRYTFGLRQKRNPSKVSNAQIEVKALKSANPTQLAKLLREVTNQLLYCLHEDEKPRPMVSEEAVDRIATKFIDRILDLFLDDGIGHNLQTPQYTKIEDPQYGQYKKLTRKGGPKGPPDDRPSGDNPRSPFQRGGR